LRFQYRVADYTGRPDVVRAFRFGRNASTPLVARSLVGEGSGMPPRKSWLSVGPEHVMITLLKRADNDQGWIVRLLEMGQSATTARLRLPGRGWDAASSDPTEQSTGERLPIETAGDDDTVLVDLKQHGLTTIRLRRP
jgi:alpha-mannosidase